MAEQTAYNIDCMEYMKSVPDKYFDLAVVDPPYGGGANMDASTHTHTHTHTELRGGSADWEGKARSRFGGWFNGYHISSADGRQVGNSLSSEQQRGYL